MIRTSCFNRRKSIIICSIGQTIFKHLPLKWTRPFIWSVCWLTTPCKVFTHMMTSPLPAKGSQIWALVLAAFGKGRDPYCVTTAATHNRFAVLSFKRRLLLKAVGTDNLIKIRSSICSHIRYTKI